MANKNKRIMNILGYLQEDVPEMYPIPSQTTEGEEEASLPPAPPVDDELASPPKKRKRRTF